MTPFRASILAAFAASVAVLRVAASTDTRQSQPIDPVQRIGLLRKAALIRATFIDETGATRQASFRKPAQLERVRGWILQYAWPPIDPNTTGNVLGRGYFEVFARATDKSPALTIQIFGPTSRAEPHIVHVTGENWQKFISLLPRK